MPVDCHHRPGVVCIFYLSIVAYLHFFIMLTPDPTASFSTLEIVTAFPTPLQPSEPFTQDPNG